MKSITNSFYCEYVRRMLSKIDTMVEEMRKESSDYFPDIFYISSQTIVEIVKECMEGDVPEYIRELTYVDYFGSKAIGRTATRKLISAWNAEPELFEIQKKNNRLIYKYPAGRQIYDLQNILDELPPMLNAEILSKSLVMDLDKAEEFLGMTFKKKLWLGRKG